MPRFLRPLLFVIAVILLVAASRAGDLPALQTAAPTGTVVLKFAPDADAADQARIARLAGRDLSPRLTATSLAALASKSRRPSPRLADLARYAQFTPPGASRDELVRLAARLAADPAVETAFLEPRAVPAALGFDAFTGAGPQPIARGTGTPLPTPDFTDQQGYLDPAPGGIGARQVWANPGARGATVRIVDVEGAWLWAHEDLPEPFLDLGGHFDDLGWRNHGTAVMGEMRGIDNEYGVEGIVPDCQVGNSGIATQSVSEALINAAANLEPGDLILIELHAPGPNSDDSGSQFGYLPMEFWQDNFDAIRAVTDLGVIVVEAAGNGQQDLDDPLYGGLFDRQVRDSGAIMIGATDGEDLWPAWFTNFGQRVDLNGWGQNVVTCAYGDLQDGDETEWYTAFFSGTSSASPIVTGAVASLQGMVEASFGFSLDANLARTILVATGTPVAGDQQIGPRPDLAAAWTLASAGVGMIAGTVIEAPGGGPIAGATVRVLPDGPRTTTAADGTYRLGLLPGDYQLHFWSYLHGELTATVTVASGENPLVTELTPLSLEVISGTVYDPAFAPLAGAQLKLIDEPVRAVESGADGTFAFAPVPQGYEHRLLAGGVPGFGGRYLESVLGPARLEFTVVLPMADHTFEVDQEGFQALGGLWQRGRPADTGMGPGAAFDGQWCWGVGLDGENYPDDAEDQLWSPFYQPDDFDGDRLYLSFHYWAGTEPGFDGVQVILDPATSATLVHPVDGYTDLFLGGLGHTPGWSGHSDGWQVALLDLTAQLDAETWNYALRFGSDGGLNDTGFLVDGITLEAVHVATAAPDGPLPAVAAPVLAAWPNPFNPRLNVAWELPAAGRLDLAVYDLRGRLVRQLVRGAVVAERGHVQWDGADQRGHALPSGVYLVQARAADGPATVQRVTLAR